MEDKIRAEIIVDMYEIRAMYNRPVSLGQMQPIEDIHKYNFFNALIAQLQDKYDIPDESIREEISRRNFEKQRQEVLESH